MEAHFDANPRLKKTKGSGWKPFNRIKWLHDDRVPSTGEVSEALARWRVVDRARALRAARRDDVEPAWSSLGPTNIAGRILSLAFQPDARETVYVGSASGGIWRSTNGGASWVPIDDNLPTLSIGAIAVLVKSPGTIVIGTGEPLIGFDGIYGLGILRSTDAGVTWQTTNVSTEPFLGQMGYYAIEQNVRTGVLLAGGSRGLLRSVDDGATWSPVATDGAWTDVKWRPGSLDSVLAVREYGGVYLSSDAGLTFQPVTSGLPPASSMGGLGKLAWSPSDPRYVYAAFSAADSFTVLGIYRSDDGGATWEFRSKPTYFFGFQGFYNNTIVVSPSGRDRIVLGGIGLNLSVDGGVTWSSIGGSVVHVDHHAIGYRPGSHDELWVGTDGGMFRSNDGGSTWEDRNSGLVTLQLYDACSAPQDSGFGYGGAQDNGIPRYRGTQNWLPTPGGDGMICHCDPSDPLHAYGEYQLGYRIVTIDGFDTWTEVGPGLIGPDRWVAPFDMDFSNPLRLVTATKVGVFETIDGAASWRRIGDGNDVVSVSISRVAPRRIWAQERSSGIVRTSEDGGATWKAVMAAPFPGIGGTSIKADPRDSLAALCTYLHHNASPPLILRTADGGDSWTDVTGDLGEQSVHTVALHPHRPGHWFAGTDVGVWGTDNFGSNWHPHGRGMPNVLVLDLEFRGDSGELRAATFGRGLWSINASAEPAVPETSGALVLEIVSRNPTSGEVNLRIAANTGPSQDLSIYSITGRRVGRVFSGPADGVARQVTWRPEGVSAGIYLAVLRAGPHLAARKIVVFR